MRRTALFSLTLVANPNKRIALSDKRSNPDQIAVDPDKLFLTLDALHWEQCAPATPKEREFFGVDQAYAGNSNGDGFEGARNLVWACRNKRCSNRNDKKWRQGIFRFLKYAQNKTCPHCKSEDIYDWEKETFQTDGELLAKTQDGRYRYETWKGEPVNVNHDDKKVIGRIEDVWPEPPKKAIVELISLDREGPHNNQRIASQIETGRVDSGSMELLTGIGMCSVCFNIHTSEDEFCDHLKNEKGMVNQRTGMHVFEICKSIQGCGHAIIATGEAADSGALVRNVFAEKKEASSNTILNSNDSTMEEGKPDFSELKAKQTRKIDPSKTAQASRSEASGYSGGEKPLPEIKDMGAQLKAFGNYDSTRTEEDVRLAAMGPQERAEYLEFKAYKEAKSKGSSVAIAQNPTFRVDKEFIAASLKPMVQTKKVSAKAISDALVELTVNKGEFAASLADRKMASHTLQRLAMRKAQLSSEDIQEMVVDVLADALIAAGEGAKAVISDVSYNDAADSAEELVGDASSDEDFQSFLSESDAEEPTVTHSDEEHVHDELPLHKPKPSKHENEDLEPSDSVKPMNTDKDKKDDEKDEDKKDKKEATAHGLPSEKFKTEKHPESKEVNDPEKLAAQNKAGKGYESVPKVEDGSPTPKQVYNPSTSVGKDVTEPEALVNSLKRRAQKIQDQIEAGEGNLDELVPEFEKVTAQLEKIKAAKPEFFKPSKDLGGGIDENPKSIEQNPGGFDRKPKTEFRPKSQDLGGGINENPKPLKLGQLKVNVGLTEDADLEEASEDQQLAFGDELLKHEIITETREAGKMSSVLDSSDLSMLKDMGWLPKDSKKAQKAEEFPTKSKDANEGKLNVETPLKPTIGAPEKHPNAEDVNDGLKKAQAEEPKKEEKPVVQPNPEPPTESDPSRTPPEHTPPPPGPVAKVTAQATKPHSEEKINKLKNVGVPTTVQEKWERMRGTPTKPGDMDAKMDASVGNDTPTKPGAATKVMDSALGRGSDSKSKDRSEKEQDDYLGRTKLTPIGREIRADSKITAEFEAVEEKNQASASNWTVLHDDEPIFRVALRDAYPGQVVAQYDTFASEEYADTLIKAIRERGIEAVHNEEFSGTSKIFTDEERTAMRKAAFDEYPDFLKWKEDILKKYPTAKLEVEKSDDGSGEKSLVVMVDNKEVDDEDSRYTFWGKNPNERKAQNIPQGAPMSVAPEVADKILNDAKPGISVLDLISSLSAPIIVESDTLSVTTFIEELVNIGQSQDKVTELTTKLNEAVQDLKQKSGLPSESNQGTTPNVSPVPVNPQMSSPQIVQAMKPVSDSEKRYAAMLQAQRIKPVVQEEQNCGLIENYNTLHAAGASRKEAADKAKEILEARVAQLMTLPEEAYLMVEKEIKTACRRARDSRGSNLPGEKRETALKKARWEKMQNETESSTGAKVMHSLPGRLTEAETNYKGKTQLSSGIKFRIAGNIDPEKVTQARKARDNRDGRDRDSLALRLAKRKNAQMMPTFNWKLFAYRADEDTLTVYSSKLKGSWEDGFIINHPKGKITCLPTGTEERANGETNSWQFNTSSKIKNLKVFNDNDGVRYEGPYD